LLRRRVAAVLGNPTRVWLLISGTAVAAAALYGAQVDKYGVPAAAPVHLRWWMFAIFFCIAEGFVLHLHFRSEAHTLSLSEFGLILGLFFASAPSLLTGQLLGALAGLLLFRRQRPTKVAFNLAQFALTTSLAIAIFREFGNGAGGGRDWTAAFFGALAACAVGILLVGAAIRLAQGELTARSLGHAATVSLTGTAVNASLALAAVAFVSADPLAIVLLVLPLAALVGVYQVYNDHRRQFEHLEFLYESMRSIQGAHEPAGAIRQVLDSARYLVRAEQAEVVLLLPEGRDNVLRSTLNGDGESLLEKSTLTLLERTALELLSDRPEATVIGRRHKASELDGYLAERGLKDAVITALRGEDRTVGLMVIGDRAGDVETFSYHDRKLCETFAAHVGLLLENDLLEKSIADLTELKEQLQYQAFHDSLTGLPNRAMFTQRIAATLAQGAPAAVLFLDLDDFKTINDSLGHASGDELLRIVAERVSESVRQEDTPARIGGDEFAVLMIGGDTAQAEQLAARLVDAVRQPMMLGGRQVSLHTSVGIAPADTACDADQLLQNADVAMYTAKSRDKRGHIVYEPAMHEVVRRRHELSSTLERAVERAEIEVHYQPIVDLGSGAVVSFEALARWRHPERGLLGPGEFVPLAVETGLMVGIGREVLRQACRQTALWRREAGFENLNVMVNLTASELENPLLVGDVARALHESGLPPNALSLEITESGVMLDPEATIDRMRRLRRLRVRLALDDFGTGYSSLSHLSRFPIGCVKIAKDFVDRVGDDAAGRAFVDTIVRLADSLGLETVAEGIEQRAQAETLRQLNCRFGQGFHFARPLDAAAAAEYLGHLRRAPAHEPRRGAPREGKENRGRPQVPRFSAPPST
jgi:diguanylate cyclase (GGDEF)-like protein